MKSVIISGNILIFVIVFFHIYALLQLIFFPYPELFIYSYLTDKGLIPYKQIFDQHFPGLMFMPINLYSLGIDSIVKMRVLHLSLIVFTDLIFAKILLTLFKRRFPVLLGLFIFAFWQIYFEGHVLWIESFVTPIILLGFYFLLNYINKRQLKYFYLTCLTLSVSLLFKQTMSPLIFIVFLYMLIKKTGIKKLFLGGLIVILPHMVMLTHWMNLGAFRDFIYWTITFNLTVFSDMGRTYPGLRDLLKLVPAFGIPVIFLFAGSFVQKNKVFQILGLYLLGTLFFSLARFDYVHLQPALPFSVLILMTAISKLKRPALPVIIYMLLSFYIFVPYFRFNVGSGVSPMFNDPRTQELVAKVKKYVGKNEKMFALGTYPHIYYLTETLPSGNIFTFQFPWFMKVAEKRVLEGIISDPPKLVIRDSGSQVGEYVLIDFMREIDGYLTSNYKVVDSINGIDLLTKK